MKHNRVPPAIAEEPSSGKESEDCDIAQEDKHAGSCLNFDSIAKWKQKGLSNINRVGRFSGKNFKINKKLPNASFFSSEDESLFSYSAGKVRDNISSLKNRTIGRHAHQLHQVADSTSTRKLNAMTSGLSDDNTDSSGMDSDNDASHDSKTFMRGSYSSASSTSLFENSQNTLYSDSRTLVNSSSTLFNKIGNLTDERNTPTPELLSASPTPFDNITETKITNIDPLVSSHHDIRTLNITYNHDMAYQLGKSSHLHYYQLPFPWRENRYIIHGYRFYHSNLKSVLSIVNWYGWHNETSNIWSHIFGAAFFLYVFLYSFPNSEIWKSTEVPKAAKLILYMFLTAAIQCLLSSVFWHTFNGTAFLKARSRFACVDYSGISILITASILTFEFITMYKNKVFMYIYMMLSTTLGLIGVYLNWSPKFDRPEARPLRIKFFVLLASVGAICILHLTFSTGFKHAISMLAPVSSKSLVWYIVGVFFYGSFIPERFRTDVQVDPSIPTTHELSTNLDITTKHKHIHFRPSPTPHASCCVKVENSQYNASRKSFKSLWWVDYIGCSHTMWHIFVVLGVIGHYRAITELVAREWLIPSTL